MKIRYKVLANYLTDFDEIILGFCNQALNEGVAPEQWRISNIIPVPKKGDLSDTNNYRGISLTSIVTKTLNRMILNRIQPEVEKKLRDNQNGFRKGRSHHQSHPNTEKNTRGSQSKEPLCCHGLHRLQEGL